MGLEGGMKCVKYLLFFFNFVFWACGLAMIIVGIIVQVTLHNTLMIRDPSASGAPIVIIVVGVIIFFIAFFGCCGAWKENYCMVTMFAVLLTLIILIEIAAAITAYVFRGKIKGIVRDSLNNMIEDYNKSVPGFRDTVDKLQEGLKCCGVSNYSDWDHYDPETHSVPDSCCVNVSKDCGIEALSKPTKLHSKGCQAALEELLQKNIQWVIVAALVIAFLQVRISN
ncbi:CD63 antigen-like [Thalassophryne amazonica]|uniref:CD63 antigen-like n=1 Tax=Thalassophryne amazonica TaxID=390379 RepID=UPI0014709722|nr:CD63 antigen-like [Thalassophryne amazonica]